MSTKAKTKSNPKFAINVLLGALMMLSLILLYKQNAKYIGKKYAVIKNTVIDLEIADTEALREKGLSGRTSLAENKGMLFVFDYADVWEFWMGGMKIPLDFLWIQGNTIVGVDKNVLPPTQTDGKPVYLRPNVAVKYVIEVNSGWADKHEVTPGDSVELHL